MKQVFRPIPLLLCGLSTLITFVFLSLFQESPDQGFSLKSYPIWGDWSAHLTFIEAFRQRGLHWILEPSPLFQDGPFRYPFLSHLLTAGFSGIIGIHSIHGMIATSAILLVLFPFLLFRFFRKWNLSPMASFYSTVGFLLLGGFQIFDQGLDPAEPLTNQFEHGSMFTQFLIFEFFPQRAFLFAICGVLWALGSLRDPNSGKSRWLAATLLGILPLLHLHSFLVLPLFILSLLCFPIPGSGAFSSRRSVIGLGSLIGGIGLVLVFFLFRQKNEHALQWNFFLPGWAQNPAAGQAAAARMNPLWFWIYNTGFFLPFSLFGFLLYRRHRDLRALALSGILLFSISLLFCVQPYFYDNLKILTFSFLFFSPFFGLFLERMRGALMLPALVLLGIQCASATKDLWSFQRGIQHTSWFGESEIRLAEEFKKIRISPDDRVLINPWHNHPIPCLTGNPVVMGYPGWLWSWGIDYASLEQSVGAVLLGTGDALAKVRDLRPKYIVVNSRESFQNKPIAISFLDANFQRLRSIDHWIIYQGEPRAR
ncbi:MAG: hypothetical protein KGP28_11065 [Bdellovibrionales bacterium]|nr:hypothetical protein [Bdellovibrionales bacterium]